MKQHMVDLLPDSVRTRSESGMVIRRYITVGVVVVIALVALSTHAHFSWERAETALNAAEQKSRLVLAVESEAKSLHEKELRLAQSIEQYDKVAPSLKMSDLQTLVSRQLPPSVTLERLDIEIIQEKNTFDPRLKETAKADSNKAKRVIRAELSGFGRTDEDVAELVKRLEALQPLTSVSVDFSKSRTVRQIAAREFRLSFKIDLDRKFEVVRGDSAEDGSAQVANGESGDVE